MTIGYLELKLAQAGFARSRRSGCVPGAACRQNSPLRARNSVPSKQSATGQEQSVPERPHWPSGRLMGFLFYRGSEFRPRVQVYREASKRPRTRWQGAWPTHAVEPAGCVAGVRRVGRRRAVDWAGSTSACGLHVVALSRNPRPAGSRLVNEGKARLDATKKDDAVMERELMESSWRDRDSMSDVLKMSQLRGRRQH
jgi:hypothetical protein